MSNEFPAEEYGRHLVDEVRAGRMSRRDLLRRASIFGLALPSVGLLLQACGADSTTPSAQTGGSPKRGGTLRAGLAVPTAAPDPVTMYDGGSIAFVQQVAEYLIWVNPDFTLRPVLATSWSPNADASVWTFQLRPGITFSDGRPLTADDVVATFERLVDPSSKSSALTSFKGVLAPGGTTKTGELEVTFHLERPFVDFPYAVASTNYNTVILPKDYAGDFATKPVGTGPFLLASYKTQVSASFTRNPRYWQPDRPYLDGVDLVFFSDVTATEAALQSGAVDLGLTQPTTGSPLLSDPNISVLSDRSTYYNELFFRTDQPPFNDKRVRQAIAYSLRRDVIAQNLYSGHAEIGNDHVWAPVFPNAPKLTQRSYDPAKAKQLLAEAGLAGGFTATLTTEQAGAIPQYATLVQAAAKEIGVTITLDVQSKSAFYGSGANQPWLTVPLGIVDWAARATAQQFFGPAFITGSKWNSAHWSDFEYDGLADQYERTIDEQSRAAIATQLASIQQDETPAVIAHWIHAISAARKKVHGVTANSNDLSSAWLG